MPRPRALRAARRAGRGRQGRRRPGRRGGRAARRAAVPGHILIEGVPGVAKTLLVRALAASLDIETRRVQFTPDLMPCDITGSLVFDARESDFTFRPGPVFTNLMLADEINRTPPKTQAALLEAMQERQVASVGTVAHAARPVPGRRDAEPDRARGHVSAARGPARPLPAQGGAAPAPACRRGAGAAASRRRLRPTRPRRGRHPARRERRRPRCRLAPRFVASRSPTTWPPTSSTSRERPGSRRRWRSASPLVVRPPSWPRAAPGRGWPVRTFVTPDDVKALAHATLAHRLSLRPEAELEGVGVGAVLDSALGSVPVPR